MTADQLETARALATPRIRGVGVLTGLGEGVAALAPGLPAGSTDPVTVPTPRLSGDRFRRATRECLLGMAAVAGATADGGIDRGALRGERTGIIYVSATAYTGANRGFLTDESSTTLHFPYTAPSAVPGEVTIELGIRGASVSLMGGATAALGGLWLAASWLATGVTDRVLVLAVEAAHEVQDLFGRARRLYAGPVVEGAVCLLLEPGGGTPFRWATAATAGSTPATTVDRVLDAVLPARSPEAVLSGAALALGRAEARALARRGLVAAPAVGGRVGETLACGPLLALARARAVGARGSCLVTATWRDDYGAMLWTV